MPGSFTSAGSPRRTCTAPLQPCAAATPATVSPIRASRRRATSGRMVRMVPAATATSGMTLGAPEPDSCVTDTTAGSIGSTAERTASCNASTARHSAGTGSVARCG